MVVESPDGDSTLRQGVVVEQGSAGGWSVTFKVKSSADFPGYRSVLLQEHRQLLLTAMQICVHQVMLLTTLLLLPATSAIPQKHLRSIAAVASVM